MAITIRHTETFDRSTTGGLHRPKRVEVHYLVVDSTLPFRVTETADARVYAGGQVAEWDQVTSRVEVWNANGWTEVETFRCADDGIESTEHAVRVALVLIGRGV